MPAVHSQLFILFPEWTIEQSGKSLLISGGADARFEIGLESDEPSFFASLKNGASFTRSDLQSRDRQVLEELLTAGMVVPKLDKGKTTKVVCLGDDTDFTYSGKGLVIVKSLQAADIALVVRTSSTYAGLLETLDYPNLAKPHLFVDMAFHHTVSIGPLVFPGETACIACLQGRVSTRWGDEVPPPEPRAVQRYHRLAAELMSTELMGIASGDTGLTNKTVSWDFQNRAVRKDQLLKVPVCPVCTRNAIDRTGAIALPWGKDESISDTV